MSSEKQGEIFLKKNIKVNQVLSVRNLILGKITKIIIKVLIIKLKILEKVASESYDIYIYIF